MIRSVILAARAALWLSGIDRLSQCRFGGLRGRDIQGFGPGTPAPLEPAVLAFLNSDRMMKWAEIALGL
jgi:hypothetical protein